MDLEQKILKLVSSNNSYIHDDCAYLSKSHQLISTDTLVENVHFNLKHFDDSKIAHRLFVCNYSDIQSSGGYPEYALLNISFPSKNFELAQQIIKSFTSVEFVSSPTYNIVNTYKYNDDVDILHCDLYRLNSYDEVLELGILDNLDKKILLVEWPNFLEKKIKDPIIFKINFGKTNYERDVIINLPKNFTMIKK